jgi:GNAT superfamily N-acetyltransferase
MELRRDDGYLVTDDRQTLDVVRIHRWLSDESYWAAGRTIDLVRRSIEGSVVLGCYSPEGAQVGFCRWVTDRATFAWLCDVFVDTGHRGKGIGVFLVGAAVAHPDVVDLRLQLLATRDAQGLYHQFGFVEPTTNFMERRPAPSVTP